MSFIKGKICGITTVEDALAAVAAGADALGFMFYEPSRRHVTSATVSEIIRELPPFIAKVGVFVNEEAQTVRQIAEECGLDTLQFHGSESPEFCRQFRLKVIKAFPIRNAESLSALADYDRETWLLDSYVAGKPGGTGSQFNWDLATQATERPNKVLLAGGLTPENVVKAVQTVHPYGVDVSSGVESAPGKKDHELIRRFIDAARR